MNDFDKKAKEWDTPEKIKLIDRIYSEICNSITINGTDSVLEFGCGTGLLGLNMLRSAGSVTFMDTSAGMLEVLSQKIKERRIKNASVLNKDLQSDLAYNDKFEIIVSSLVLHHIPDVESLFERFKVNLSENGRIVIVDLVTEDGSFHGEDFVGHNGFDPSLLAELLMAKGYRNVRYKVFMEVKKENRSYPLFMLIGER